MLSPDNKLVAIDSCGLEPTLRVYKHEQPCWNTSTVHHTGLEALEDTALGGSVQHKVKFNWRENPTSHDDRAGDLHACPDKHNYGQQIFGGLREKETEWFMSLRTEADLKR